MTVEIRLDAWKNTHTYDHIPPVEMYSAVLIFEDNSGKPTQVYHHHATKHAHYLIPQITRRLREQGYSGEVVISLMNNPKDARRKDLEEIANTLKLDLPKLEVKIK